MGRTPTPTTAKSVDTRFSQEEANLLAFETIMGTELDRSPDDVPWIIEEVDKTDCVSRSLIGPSPVLWAICCWFWRQLRLAGSGFHHTPSIDFEEHRFSSALTDDSLVGDY